MFVDLENLAMGFQNSRKTKFDIQKVLERLVEKGKLIVKKSYADWSRYQGYTAPFHEAAIELIEIPRRSQTGKNSADIRLVVDAMDLAWSKPHVDTFVIVSGDSDFSPLVSKLKENGKHVIGLGMKGSTSELLRDNCDEFIYYEDLERQEQDDKQLATDLYADLPERNREVYSLLIEACNALRRENHEVLYASMIKDTMKRKKPSFNETYHGYHTFSELLEDAQKEGLLELETDKRSRTYVVTRFGSEMSAPPAELLEARKKKSRRRRSGTRKKPTLPEAVETAVVAAEAPAEPAERDLFDSAPAPAPAEKAKERESEEVYRFATAAAPEPRTEPQLP